MRNFDRCIGGYAGCGNLGDDAILQGYLCGLDDNERRGVVVLSGHPRRDRRRFGVRCAGRKNPFAVMYYLLRSRRFLLGGGSLLQNGTGRLSLLYYLGLLRLARFCGCETELLAAGIGPLRGERAIRSVVRELKKCRFIQLRDANSALFLKKRGISPLKLSVVDDPALLLSAPAPTRRFFLLREQGLDLFSLYYCVILRSPTPENDGCIPAIAEALRVLAAKTGAAMVFLPLDYDRDIAVTSRVFRYVGGRIVRPRDVSEALALISGCRRLLSMRLHGLILARALCIPSLAVSPDSFEPKLASFCLEHHIPHLSPSQTTVSSLVELMGAEL